MSTGDARGQLALDLDQLLAHVHVRSPVFLFLRLCVRPLLCLALLFRRPVCLPTATCAARPRVLRRRRGCRARLDSFAHGSHDGALADVAARERCVAAARTQARCARGGGRRHACVGSQQVGKRLRQRAAAEEGDGRGGACG